MTGFVTSCVSYHQKESSRHRRAASWRQLIRKYGIVDCVAVCMQGISFVAERLVERARTGDRAAWRVFMRKKKAGQIGGQEAGHGRILERTSGWFGLFQAPCAPIMAKLGMDLFVNCRSDMWQHSEWSPSAWSSDRSTQRVFKFAKGSRRTHQSFSL